MRSLYWLLLAAVGLGLVVAPTAIADDTQAPAAEKKADAPKKAKEAKTPEEAKKPAAPRKPLLWVVDSEPRIYLFGTIHIGDPRVLDHPPVVQKALDESGALYTEVNMDEMDPMKLMPKLTLPGDETLTTVLGEELWKRLDKKMRELGTPLMLMNKMKPFVIYFRLQLAGLEPEQMENPALDMALFGDAKKEDKVVGGLETIEEQLDIFDSLTLEEQTQLIVSTLDALEQAKESGAEAPIQGLIDIYLKGDIDTMMEAMLSQVDNSDPFTRKLMKRVLDDRNVLMADRMIEKLKLNPDKTHFVAVGAAHYGGDMGILNLLRKKGYTVWRATKMEHLEGPPKKATVGSPSSRRAPVRGWRRVRVGPFCIRVPCCTCR